MAETSRSSGTTSSTLAKEWFDDSSSDNESDRISNCHRVRLRRIGETRKSVRAPDLMKKVETKVDVRVTVKIAFVPEASLTAHVGVSLKNANSTFYLSRQPKKKGKGSVENWRDRPVCACVRAHRHFQRTLPGELCRTIILARRVSSATTVGDAQGIDALADVDGGGLTEWASSP